MSPLKCGCWIDEVVVDGHHNKLAHVDLQRSILKRPAAASYIVRDHGLELQLTVIGIAPAPGLQGAFKMLRKLRGTYFITQ